MKSHMVTTLLGSAQIYGRDWNVMNGSIAYAVGTRQWDETEKK